MSLWKEQFLSCVAQKLENCSCRSSTDWQSSTPNARFLKSQYAPLFVADRSNFHNIMQLSVTICFSTHRISTRSNLLYKIQIHNIKFSTFTNDISDRCAVLHSRCQHSFDWYETIITAAIGSDVGLETMHDSWWSRISQQAPSQCRSQLLVLILYIKTNAFRWLTLIQDLNHGHTITWKNNLPASWNYFNTSFCTVATFS
jgi:hypothetical protein